ncbi:DUF6538 domain-containing protein [Salipiger mucosus]|uniref:Site-specific recombinase, phage integrase family n=1 Tax=Salipiger mucosus DSM 16094 TaxID=1123237 RepID=S9RNY8_9RHOB|nr:DUF6538 domain-containing protein [Salipiger mucosus]EPX79805.1 Site-specific recombinase, phage integrase family [Salipiger mucosus DSM 16094]
MSIVLFKAGACVLMANFIEQKKNSDVYYFRRRIPDDVAHCYPGKKVQIRCSLKTRDPKVAAKKAHKLALQQDALWKAVREGKVTDGPDVVRAAMEVLSKHGLLFLQRPDDQLFAEP